MKLHVRLQQAHSTIFTCEIVPPLKSQNDREMWLAIESLAEFKPGVMDVTYHRAEPHPAFDIHGCKIQQWIRKRAGTLGICGAILYRYHLDPVPHFVCAGLDCGALEDMLLDCHWLGIENIMVLQGDKLPKETQFSPHPLGHRYASELLTQVMSMQKGKYCQAQNATPVSFCIGVAGYPEKHHDAPTMEADLDALAHKVRLGANYIVTQMFFDNQKYFAFVKSCRERGISIPILPGIKPITTKKQATVLPGVFHIELPNELQKQLDQAKNDAEVEQIGIEWCVAQCLELKAACVPAIHFYTMSKAEPTLKILKKVF